ncbi:MAG: hypothetical protein ACOYNL_08200 [Rickettsiales bacterium]
MVRMMKIVPVGILVAAIIGGGAAWYVLGGKAITQAQQLIDGFNTKTRPDGSTIKLTYHSMERTGFPAIGVRLVNPVIDITVPANGGETLPITAQWKREGTVDIITDYISHEYRFRNDGKGTAFLQVGDEKTSIAMAESHSKGVLTAKNRGAFDAWATLDLKDQEAVKRAIQNIAGLQLTVGPLKVTDEAGSTVLFTQEKADISIDNRSAPGQITVTASAEMKGTEVTEQYSVFMQRASHMLRLKDNVGDPSLPLSIVRAGKQDIEFAANVNMPEPGNGPMPNAQVHVSKLLIKNNFYNISAPFDIVLKESADRRDATIHTNWSFEFTQQGADEMRSVINNNGGFASILRRATPEGGNNVDPATLQQKVDAILPTVSTLGPIMLKANITASVPGPKAPERTKEDPEIDQETLNIAELEFGHKRWAITAKGKLARSSKNGSIANLDLICKQCPTLTSDIYQTLNAVQDALNLLNPARVQWPANDAWHTQVDSTLAQVGTKDEATGDITFNITTPKPNDIRVNGRPSGEVVPALMMLYMSAVPPRPEPTPPAPPPGAKPMETMPTLPKKLP